MSDQPFREMSRGGRVVLWTVAGLVVLFGGLYVAGYFFTSDRVPRGTTVEGVQIGGMRPAAAEAKLTEQLRDEAEQPIVVVADGERRRITPADAGLGIDHAASVAQAGGGRSWHPARMWDYFTGGDDYDAVVTVDEADLGAAIDRIAEEVDRPARDGVVRFRDASVRTREPRSGQQVDRERAAALVEDAFLAGEEPLELPIEAQEPEIDETDVSRALEDFANPAVSAPVTIDLAGEAIVLRPEDYAPALSMENENGSLVPQLDQDKLVKAMESAMQTFALNPVPATVKLVDGEPQVVPGEDGITFNRDRLADQFLSVVIQRGDNRTLELEGEVEEPDFTTKDARKLGIKEVVSEFTTYFPHAEYRNVNLGRAAELINGTVLKPGETFSLNQTTGERTEENGFTEGFIISDGVYKEDFGGGVSQVATTLFNAAFFAGLKDVEHKPHSFYISRYPVGREATVAWGAVDLRFKNTTPYGILIETWIEPSTPSSQGEMHARMWSTDYWDITTSTSERYNFTEPETRYIDDEDCVPNEGYGGFDVDVFRYFRKAGSDELVRTEKMHTTYTPSDTVVCQ